jgi:hypothetical protein
MSQTAPALDPSPPRSLAEAAPAQTEMDVRPILSHELLVGDYLGVITSMQQPEHFRRVEKLEYIDADLGRSHLKHDVFYLEAANMGPVIAWCHGGRRPHLVRCPPRPADSGRAERVLGRPQRRGGADVQLLSPSQPDRHLAAAPNPGTASILATRLGAGSIGLARSRTGQAPTPQLLWRRAALAPNAAARPDDQIQAYQWQGQPGIMAGMPEADSMRRALRSARPVRRRPPTPRPGVDRERGPQTTGVQFGSRTGTFGRLVAVVL